jgi:hypothetical protein
VASLAAAAKIKVTDVCNRFRHTLTGAIGFGVAGFANAAIPQRGFDLHTDGSRSGAP